MPSKEIGKPKGLSLTPEERQARSERAKELHREGKFGGANKGQGRKKKVTANEKIAQEASRHGQKMMDKLLNIIETSKKPPEVMNAIKMILEIEAKETERKSNEEKNELEGKSKDELIKYVFDQLIEKQKLKPKEIDEPFIEGKAEEI